MVVIVIVFVVVVIVVVVILIVVVGILEEAAGTCCISYSLPCWLRGRFQTRHVATAATAFLLVLFFSFLRCRVVDVVVLGHDLSCRTVAADVITGRCSHGIPFVHVWLLSWLSTEMCNIG